jgi:hypothetical protein
VKLLILLLSLFLLPLIPANAEAMRPPFGLEWGESEQRMEALLTGAKAKIVQRRVHEGRDMWIVEGLVQANLKQTVFYFHNGGLVEVELRYQNPGWVDTEYSAFLTQLRTKIESRFGQGKLITRSKTPIGDVTQTLVGYRWVKASTQMEIIYFAAEKPSEVYRTVSLHYKAVY